MATELLFRVLPGGNDVGAECRYSGSWVDLDTVLHCCLLPQTAQGVRFRGCMLNASTVDVEEYFHPTEVQAAVDQSRWAARAAKPNGSCAADPTSITEAALHLRDEAGRKCDTRVACRRDIRQHNSDNGAGGASGQNRVLGQQDLSEVFAGNDAALGLIPVEHQHSRPGILNGILIDFILPAAGGNQRRIVLPDFPTGAWKTVFRGVHAFARTLLRIESNEQIQFS